MATAVPSAPYPLQAPSSRASSGASTSPLCPTRSARTAASESPPPPLPLLPGAGTVLCQGAADEPRSSPPHCAMPCCCRGAMPPLGMLPCFTSAPCQRVPALAPLAHLLAPQQRDCLPHHAGRSGPLPAAPLALVGWQLGRAPGHVLLALQGRCVHVRGAAAPPAAAHVLRRKSRCGDQPLDTESGKCRLLSAAHALLRPAASAAVTW